MSPAANTVLGENNPSFKKAFAEQGNEISEIISKQPSLWVRRGTTIFFLILVIIFGICWFIQYPDLVTTKARLNSINAPKEVITRTDGKLQTILVNNGDSVSAETKLAFMESIAYPPSIYKVKTQVDSISSLIAQNRTNEIIRFFPDYTNQLFLQELGELQHSFQTFMQSFISFRDFISNGFYLRKRNMLQTDLINIKRLHDILQQQKELLQQDVALTKETFTANESLAKDKVISAMDYRNEKSKLIAKELTLPQVNSAIINNDALQNEKKKEMAELENKIIVQKNSFIQALQTFSSQIEEWEKIFVLKAPVSGQASFVGFFQENQFIKSGQLLFYIQPMNTSYFAELIIPQYNFGKVKAGQEVLLKFQAYPYEQFGSVTGTIEFISTTPTDSGFLAKVSLPHGLTTNYHKTLHYQYGLYAQADIITENMRLLERFYYKIRKQLTR
jgi:HlyD family secretion protein